MKISKQSMIVFMIVLAVAVFLVVVFAGRLAEAQADDVNALRLELAAFARHSYGL